MIECKKCGGDMHVETNVDDTEKADISFEDRMVCEECGYEYIINNN